MKYKVLTSLALAAALVVGGSIPAQAATAYTFGNTGPGLAMVVKLSSGTITTLPVGARINYVTQVSVPLGKCVTLWVTPYQYRRCGITKTSWWDIPATGYYTGKLTEN